MPDVRPPFRKYDAGKKEERYGAGLRHIARLFKLYQGSSVALPPAARVTQVILQLRAHPALRLPIRT